MQILLQNMRTTTPEEIQKTQVNLFRRSRAGGNPAITNSAKRVNICVVLLRGGWLKSTGFLSALEFDKTLEMIVEWRRAYLAKEDMHEKALGQISYFMTEGTS